MGGESQSSTLIHSARLHGLPLANAHWAVYQ
jgi:hypothetical protein